MTQEKEIWNCARGISFLPNGGGSMLVSIHRSTDSIRYFRILSGANVRRPMENSSPSCGRELVFVLAVLHGVASTDFLTHFAVHPGQRYGDVTFTTRERTLGLCGMSCARRRPPCYAFNYRESDGSCQLVLEGKSGLLESNGYSSYVQSESWLCPRSFLRGFLDEVLI